MKFRRQRSDATFSEPETPPLGDLLEFMRLLWAIDHGLQKTSKRMAVSLGITGPQRLVIRILGRFPGISAGRLALILCLHPSTLSGILERLERRGLIERHPDPRDRRCLQLALSNKGRRLDVQTPGTIETAIEQALRGLPATSVAAARSMLAALGRALETTSTP